MAYVPPKTEYDRFMEPLKHTRIIQRSHFLFEMEIPIRSDCIAGAVFKKIYSGNRFAIKVELLYKGYPERTQYQQFFESRALENVCYTKKHEHEHFLKMFMDEPECNQPTPTQSPNAPKSKIFSHHDKSSGVFFPFQQQMPLQIPRVPKYIDLNQLTFHPQDAPLTMDRGPTITAPTTIASISRTQALQDYDSGFIPPPGPSQSWPEDVQRIATKPPLAAQPTPLPFEVGLQSYQESVMGSSSHFPIVVPSSQIQFRQHQQLQGLEALPNIPPMAVAISQAQLPKMDDITVENIVTWPKERCDDGPTIGKVLELPITDSW